LDPDEAVYLFLRPVSPTPVVAKYFHVGFLFGSFSSGRPHFFQFARTFSLMASGKFRSKVSCTGLSNAVRFPQPD
jgi:hypothetical protein